MTAAATDAAHVTMCSCLCDHVQLPVLVKHECGRAQSAAILQWHKATVGNAPGAARNRGGVALVKRLLDEGGEEFNA